MKKSKEMSKETCHICKGDGKITAEDKRKKKIKVKCPVCEGTGIEVKGQRYTPQSSLPLSTPGVAIFRRNRFSPKPAPGGKGRLRSAQGPLLPTAVRDFEDDQGYPVPINNREETPMGPLFGDEARPNLEDMSPNTIGRHDEVEIPSSGLESWPGEVDMESGEPQALPDVSYMLPESLNNSLQVEMPFQPPMSDPGQGYEVSYPGPVPPGDGLNLGLDYSPEPGPLNYDVTVAQDPMNPQPGDPIMGP